MGKKPSGSYSIYRTNKSVSIQAKDVRDRLGNDKGVIFSVQDRATKDTDKVYALCKKETWDEIRIPPKNVPKDFAVNNTLVYSGKNCNLITCDLPKGSKTRASCSKKNVKEFKVTGITDRADIKDWSRMDGFDLEKMKVL